MSSMLHPQTSHGLIPIRWTSRFSGKKAKTLKVKNTGASPRTPPELKPRTRQGVTPLDPQKYRPVKSNWLAHDPRALGPHALWIGDKSPQN